MRYPGSSWPGSTAICKKSTQAYNREENVQQFPPPQALFLN